MKHIPAEDLVATAIGTARPGTNSRIIARDILKMLEHYGYLRVPAEAPEPYCAETIVSGSLTDSCRRPLINGVCPRHGEVGP